jgi:hypothetical protein
MASALWSMSKELRTFDAGGYLDELAEIVESYK